MKNLLLTGVLCLFGIIALRAQNYADVLIESGPCENIVALVCPAGIENPENAVDANRQNFATVKSILGTSLLGNTAYIHLGFSEPAPGGSRIGIEIGELNQNLNVDLLQQLQIQIFDPNGNELFSDEALSLQNIGVLSNVGENGLIQFQTVLGQYEIGSVRLAFTALINVAQEFNLHGVYADIACPGVQATHVLSSVSVDDPDFAVDEDPDNYALMNLPLAILNSSSLELALEYPANPGDFVGFEVAKDNVILGLGLIENISVIALDFEGNELDRNDDFQLADLVLLEGLSPLLGSLTGMGGSINNRSVIGFNTSTSITEPIARLKIEIAPIVGVLVDMAVYGGFYYSNALGLNVTTDRPGITSGETANLTVSGNYESFAWSNGAVGRTTSVTEAGTYTVTATRFDGCEVSTSINILALDCAKDNPFASEVVATGDCESQTILFCPSGVLNPENAADGDLETFATLSSSIGVSLIESTAFIELAFDQVHAGGSDINIVLQPLNEILNVDVLDRVSIELFDEANNSVMRRSDIGVQDIQLLSGEGGQKLLSVTSPFGNYSIKKVRIELEALVNVLQEVAVYGVYGSCACPGNIAGNVIESVSANNAAYITDNDPNNYATLDIPLGIAQSASIHAGFGSPALEGDFVGFTVAANNDLLSAGVISDLSIELYDEAGNVVTTLSDFQLVDLVAAEQAAGILGGLLGLGSDGIKPYVLGGYVPEGLADIHSAKLILTPTIGLLISMRVYSAFYKASTKGVTITSTAATACELQEATLTAPEGFADYLWSTGETTREITVTGPGFYTVSIVRGSGCSSFGSFNIAKQDLNIDVAVSSPSCNQSNGSASVSVNGETAGFEFTWNTGATTASIDNIASGVYEVTVFHPESGCSAVKQVLVSDLDAPKFAFWVRQATCGLTDGAIFLTLPEGATIQWLSGQTTPIIRNLGKGVYTAIVTFADGCKRVVSYEVIDQSDFGLSIEATPSACAVADGAISLTVAAAGDYTYEWSNGATVKDLVALAPGVYSVIVTNIATRCQDIAHIDVSSVGSPEVNLLSALEETCARQVNGSIALDIVSANPVSVLWNTGQTTSTIENLGPGFYTVSVMDDFGCEATRYFELVARDSLNSEATATPTFCEPPFTGSASVASVGGRAPYNVLWSTGDITTTITGLALGDYTATVRDANGCVNEIVLFVDEDESCKSIEEEEDDDILEDEDDINNIYTPNGDGSNDKWVLGIDLSTFDQVEVRVVNIYGTEVFEEPNYNDNWNGTYRNSADPLPDGTYYYDMLLKRGSKEKQLKAFVTIKR